MTAFLYAIAATLLLVSPSSASSDEAPKSKRGVVGVGGADWLIHPPPFPAFPVPNSFDASSGPWASSASFAALPLAAAAAAAAAAAGPWAPRALTPISPAHATTALDLVALRKRIELAVAQQKYAAAAAAAASAREIAAVSAAKEAVRDAAEQRNHAAKAAAAAAATFSQQSAHSQALNSRPSGPHSKPSYGPWQ